MTGFENAANVAEETHNPVKAFPRALIGGMIVAGVLYVLVALSTSLVAPIDDVAGSAGALLVGVSTARSRSRPRSSRRSRWSR